MSQAGGQWIIEAKYYDGSDRYLSAADVHLRWSDSFVQGYHPAQLGQAIQLALQEAKKRAYATGRRRKR